MNVYRSQPLWAIVLTAACLAPVVAGPASADDSATPERRAAQALVDKGIALSDGSEEEEQYYLEAYQTDPSYARPLFDLGLVYTDRRMYSVALTYFEQFLEFEPNSLTGLYQIAGCYDNLGRDSEALDAYVRYLRRVSEAGTIPEEERPYVEFATKAVRRISGKSGDAQLASASASDMPVVTRSEQVRSMMDQYNGATPEEIVEYLTRPRIRAANFRLESGPVYANSGILFEKDSARLLPDSYDELDRIAEALMNDKLAEFKMKIGGHASTEGDAEHNLQLSQRRAAAVKDYLVREYDIPAARLDTSAYGERLPLVEPEETEKDRKHNRRVEFENTGIKVEVVAPEGTLPQ